MKNSSIKILLIEDNKVHAELIKRALSSDFTLPQITYVSRADLAYEILQDHEFDVILTEFVFDGIKGIRHIIKLKKMAEATPIVIITRNGDEEAASRSIRAGAADYIVKSRKSLGSLSQTVKDILASPELYQKPVRAYQPVPVYHDGFKKLIFEVESIKQKIKSLTSQKKRKLLSSSNFSEIPTLRKLQDQVESLSNFVKKSFM